MSTLSRRLFKNTVLLTVADLTERGGSMLLSFVISRLLYAAGLGVYATATAYYGLIALAGGTGVKDFLVREIAKEPSSTSRYVIHTSVIGTILSALAMAVFVIVLPYLGYSVDMTNGMFAIILAIVPGTLNTVLQAVFIAHQRLEFVMYTRFIGTLATIGLSIYLLLRGYGVVSLLVVFVIVEYLVTICLYYFVTRHITDLRWEFNPSFALHLVWDVRAFAAMSLLAGLFAKPEIFLLSFTQSDAQIGFYSAAIRLVGFWYFISQVFMTNVYPVLSRSHHMEDQSFQLIQDKSIKYLLALALPLTTGIIAAARPIVELVYGPGFEEAVLPLQILAWNLPLAFLSSVLWRVLAARDQQSSVLWVRIITLAIRLGSGYVLIARWASLGAAIASTANLLINYLLLAFYVKRGGIRIAVLRLGWRFGVAALSMGLLTWAFGHQLELWFLVPLEAGIYVALILLFRAFSPDDLALFQKVWRPGHTQET